MRFTTAASFLVAAILAIGAVFGVQQWLSTERQQIQADVARELQRAEEEKAPKATIVVADKIISFGERIEPNVLREIEWSSDVFPEGAFSKIEDVVVGREADQQRFALTQITYGEPILSSKITMPGQTAKLSAVLTPGLKAVSIRVNDVLGVAGFVLPGDRVDVMITRGRGGSSYVDVLLQGVRVIAIDQQANTTQDKPSVVRTVTFEVSTAEAQKLVLGANVGTLSLALRNAGSGDVEEIDRITAADLNDEDIADELLQATADKNRLDELEAQLDALAEANAQGDEENADDSRLNELEAQLRALAESNAARAAEQEAAPVAKVTPTFLQPSNTNVGVIRNGSRKEYKVPVVEALADGQDAASTQGIDTTNAFVESESE